jgi:hypothetical protein
MMHMNELKLRCQLFEARQETEALLGLSPKEVEKQTAARRLNFIPRS